ncbi:MAG: hypothetical protein LUQ18_02760 [Methylococcaceae bacterium]|nr:hypothetical protein [Methylococcaceae bacterium]
MNTKHDDEKMVLSAKAREETCKAHSACVDEFLATSTANVIGLAEGIKWKDGKPTGEPALIVLVTHKMDKNQITHKDLVPTKLGDMQTDVLAVGFKHWQNVFVPHKAVIVSGIKILRLALLPLVFTIFYPAEQLAPLYMALAYPANTISSAIIMCWLTAMQHQLAMRYYNPVLMMAVLILRIESPL